MKIRRTPFAMAIAAISLGLLAACSDEADQAAEAPVEQVTPPPANAPVDTAPPVDSSPPSAAPDTGTTMPPAAAPDTETTMPPPVEETITPEPGTNPSGG